MRNLCILFFSLINYYCFSQNIITQKPAINIGDFKKWDYVDGLKISNDGKYVCYSIYGSPIGSSTLIIESTERNWKKEVIGVSNAVITENSHSLILLKSKDTLCIVKLGVGSCEAIPNVTSYKTPEGGNGQWLAYELNNSSKSIVLYDLFNGKKYTLSSAIDYGFNLQGDRLLLSGNSGGNSLGKHVIQLVNLSNHKTSTIYTGGQVDNLAFDDSGKQLSFIAQDIDNRGSYTLWYYNTDMEIAVLKASDKTPGLDSNVSLNNGTPRFSKDGKRIFFELKENTAGKPITAVSNAPQVDIWNYKDEKLLSQQLNEIDITPYLAVTGIEQNYITQLSKRNERIMFSPNKSVENFVLLSVQEGSFYEENWNIKARTSLFIVSTQTGKRVLVKSNLLSAGYASLSPNNKYVIYPDNKTGHSIVYNTENGTTLDVTKNVLVPLNDEDDDHPVASSYLNNLSTWLYNDTAVLLYDRNDIWKIDPEGKRPPINLTSGYGRKHNIIFRLTYDGNYSDNLLSRQTLLLTAFNSTNKDNGFYSLNLADMKSPKLLTMGSYIYNLPQMYPSSSVTMGFPPVKALRNNRYVVKRMNTKEAPNYYCTTDFKTFKSLSSVAPHKRYNWMTAELLRWNTYNGEQSEGILYKPEDFDPNKKYPIIFYFYERLADQLNQYMPAEASGGPMNIPHFVSNNYLVFMPDIHYKIGEPGESAYNSIVSAAKYLCKNKWIDSARMGIQGHSFGGFEVNYLITHTSLFAAAATAAGLTNLISCYGGISENGHSLEYLFESGQLRIGSTLWENPTSFIRNSPVFNLNYVQTPLLIMHNKNDDSVPWAQSLELFTGLRRLQKPVWMLQYESGTHQLFREEDTKDYSIRLMQFFDHYLKGKLPPVWMTRGIPARLKGIETGYELDSASSVLGEGLLTPEAKAKVDSLQKRGPVKVTIE